METVMDESAQAVQGKTLLHAIQLLLQEIPMKDIKHQFDPSGWILRNQGPWSEQEGTLVRIVNLKEEVLAAIVIAPAEKSRFQKITHLDEKKLNKSIFISSIWVSPHTQISEMLPAILYFGLSIGRIWGRKLVLAMLPIPNPDYPIATLLKLNRFENINDFHFENIEFMVAAQELNYSLYSIYQQCRGEALQLIKSHFGREILEMHRAWLNRFYSGSWTQSILNKTLAKHQYINCLFNLHQYVRHTTRLCARSIAFAENIDLRNHYINHLRGEVNHELIIEKDLKHLGADVEYLKSAHVPDPETKEFMVVQESTIGFYQDPVLMLACPLAAEGVAAHMSQEFLNSLEQTISSWGVSEPKQAMRFLASHVHTDGGEDGHWNQVVQTLNRFIQDESYLQKFLSVLTAAMNGFERGFNATVENFQLWTSTPSSK